MSDHRRSGAEGGQELVRNTLTRGQPLPRRKLKLAIPIGIEKLLARAAGDPAFRRALTRDRYAAVTAAGFALGDSERAILESVSVAMLDTLISRIDLKRHSKRRFMKGVAAAAFAAAALTAGAACSSDEHADPATDVVPVESIGESSSDSFEMDFEPGICKGDTADLPSDVFEMDFIHHEILGETAELSSGIDYKEEADIIEVDEMLIDGETAGLPPEIDEE
jgi:hypothetical protein